jgi:hypothetical protein
MFRQGVFTSRPIRITDTEQAVVVERALWNTEDSLGALAIRDHAFSGRDHYSNGICT